MLAISMTSMSQTCPIITSTSLYNVYVDTACLWAMSFGYKAGTGASVKVNISIPMTAPTCIAVSGTGSYTIFSIPGFCNETPTYSVRINPGAICDSTAICNALLALPNKLEYKNGMLYFKGRLFHRESRSVFNVSPVTPALIGEYYSVENGQQSNTVYVSKVNKQTNWIVYDAIGREVNTFILGPNKVLMKEAGMFYRQTNKN